MGILICSRQTPITCVIQPPAAVHCHPSSVSRLRISTARNTQGSKFIYQSIRSQLRPIRLEHRDSAFALDVLRPTLSVSCGRSMAVCPALLSHRLAQSAPFARSQAESTTSGTGWPILGLGLATKPPCLSQGWLNTSYLQLSHHSFVAECQSKGVLVPFDGTAGPLPLRLPILNEGET